MTFTIDTGAPTGPDFSFGRMEADDGLAIDLSDWTRADRFKRKTINDIWQVENADTLNMVMAGASHMLDALWLAHPDMAEEVTENEQDCRTGLTAAEKKSAQADADPAQPGNSLGINF